MPCVRVAGCLDAGWRPHDQQLCPARGDGYRRIEAGLGPIDVRVNVAFAGSLAFFLDTSPEEFRRMLITELRASGSKVTVGLVTLPGVNTTQFNWNLNQMPRHPTPVPPIVQPEVCARGGRIQLRPRDRDAAASHCYVAHGNQLQTVFTTVTGRVRPTR
jgi:NAD(P)-dependent dehydrogenase (short-subunit alcohol dehydrogenase family)